MVGKSADVKVEDAPTCFERSNISKDTKYENVGMWNPSLLELVVVRGPVQCGRKVA